MVEFAAPELTVKRFLLPFVVFLTGACVLIVEVLAVRVLSPYYGNTIFTVSSVISFATRSKMCSRPRSSRRVLFLEECA